MKLRNVLVWAAALFAVVGFFVAFAAGFNTSIDRQYLGIILGKVRYLFADGKIMETSALPKANVSLAGIIIGLLAGLVLVFVPFSGEKGKARRWIVLCCSVVLLASAIMTALIRVSFVAECASNKGVSYGWMWSYHVEGNGLKTNAGGVFTALFFALSVACAGASEFVPNIKLGK